MPCTTQLYTVLTACINLPLKHPVLFALQVASLLGSLIAEEVLTMLQVRQAISKAAATASATGLLAVPGVPQQLILAFMKVLTDCTSHAEAQSCWQASCHAMALALPC